MTQKTNKRPAKTGPVKIKKKHGRTALIFWICLILVAAPFVALGYILFSSSQNTHVPVLGNRYAGDLDPAITETQMATIKSKTAAIAGVDQADIEMATATLRVYADMGDDATAESATAVANSVYTAVSEVLDPSVYFTKTDTKKMYDLEIHVFTHEERTGAEGENFVYVIETKTSSMSEPAAQVVSTPRDAELAQELRDAVTARTQNNNTSTGAGSSDTTGGSDEAASEGAAQ